LASYEKNVVVVWENGTRLRGEAEKSYTTNSSTPKPEIEYTERKLKVEQLGEQLHRFIEV